MTLLDLPADETDLPTCGNPDRFGGRWRFVGAGLSNVWRYGDLELPAHSGRLLLRGPNGTGKTTALEALWPYLLDLNSRKLSAGKARTTSLTSLMRDGADSKLRVGYIWASYAAPDTNDVVSYGVRISYSAGTASTKAMPFFVPGRPLHELPLYEQRRATLTVEAFTAAVVDAGGIVFASDDDYIRDLATRVFQTEPSGLVMLATRIRAVRDPTLLGEVSPAQAATALRASLPGVDPQVIADTADALAESDTTRAAFERDRDAAVRLDEFARVWAGHVVDVTDTTLSRATEAAAHLNAVIAKHERLDRAHARAVSELAAADIAVGELSDQVVAKAAEVAALAEHELFKQGAELTELRNTADAQAGMAEAGFEALVQAASRVRSNGASLRRQLGELADDTAAVADQARRADPAAPTEDIQIVWDDQPRPARSVADVSVDAGSAVVLRTTPAALTATSATWEQLATTHRSRAESAKLALTEHASNVAPLDESSRAAARRADELQQTAERRNDEAAASAAAARSAGAELVGQVVAWAAEAGVLGEVVDDEFAAVAADEPAQILAAVIETGAAAAAAARAQILRHELAASQHDTTAGELEASAAEARRQAAELRDGRLLALPRPAWAGPGDDNEALGAALEWNADVSEDRQHRIEAALAAAGVLGATVHTTAGRTTASTHAWVVDTTGADVHPNLGDVVHVADGHQHQAQITSILAKIALRPDAGGDAPGLVIGEDGTYRTGVLYGDTTTVPASSARYVGERQRRESALRQADTLDETAAADEAAAVDARTDAATQRGAARELGAQLDSYPDAEPLRAAESRRVAAAQAAETAKAEYNTQREIAQDAANKAAAAHRTWIELVASMQLPAGLGELAAIRDTGSRTADDLTNAARRLTTTIVARVRRLTDDIASDDNDAAALAGLEVAAQRSQAVWLATDQRVKTIEANIGASILEIEEAHRTASIEHAELDARLQAARQHQTAAVSEEAGLEGQLRAAGEAVAAARPGVEAANAALRALLAVPGVTDVLFDMAVEVTEIDDSDLTDLIAAGIAGKPRNAKRTVREREEAARAALSGIWAIDPGDDHPELESYVLTHREVTYTPTGARRHAASLAAGAEAALKEADANALQEFVIGKLPKAISRGWETMMDWRREVNTKMRSARASSGVTVQVRLSVRGDLPAHSRTVYELLCKTTDGQRLPEARAQVADALQALIAGADGDDMRTRVDNAVRIADWVDVSYEVTREGRPPTVWGSRTGLSGGERRLVVLAPMLAAVAAAYDRISTRGLRLAALDEVPAEVDERGREGLARYIAELDLDLVCTSYLWDGAPGAWDGVDAHDLEAADDGTVVAFPMLVRGVTPLPGDTLAGTTSESRR